jgi:hypothetical protein
LETKEGDRNVAKVETKRIKIETSSGNEVEVEVKTTTDHDRNRETRHPVVPSGWVEVYSYTPCHTLCSPDCYGLKDMREKGRVLDAVCIEHVKLETHHKTIYPQGSGPGGMVRFGDGMVPSDYRVAVPERNRKAAEVAIREHQDAVKAWLYEDGEIPKALFPL